MKRIILLALVLLFIVSNNQKIFAAKGHSGKNFLLYNSSTSSLGRGGTGVSSLNSDSYITNPAAISDIEIFSMGLNYSGFVSPYSYYDASVFIPTSYGIIGGSFQRMVIDEDALDIKDINKFTFGGAKDFSKYLSAGLSLVYIKGNDIEEAVSYYGFNAGFIYKLFLTKNFGNGFGIYNPRIGASLQFGLTNPTDNDNAEYDIATGGYSFDFYNSSKLNLKFLNDVSLLNFEDLPVKFGLEATIFDKVIVRGGTSFPQSYDYGDYNFGLGYKINSDNIHMDINYALVHYSKSDFVHSVGLNLQYGELDRSAPETQLKASDTYISPNYDGFKDFINLDLEVSDRSPIKGWKVEIVDSNGKLIKEFKALDRDVEDTLTPFEFVRRIFKKQESLVVPDKVLWDGTNSTGKVVPDGEYSYTFMAWDIRDNYSSKKLGKIILDNTPPQVGLDYEYTLFSPNKDGKKDSLNMKLTSKSNIGDKWSAFFISQEGKIVKTYKWSGATIPSTLSWDGTDDKGADVEEGIYSFFMTGKDEAGNNSFNEIKNITLTRKYETIDISTSKESFSYNIDKSLIIKPNLSSKNGLINWEIVIEDGDPVKSFKGGNSIGNEILWDVKDDDSKKLDDGKYFISFKSVYDSGNEPATFKKEIIVDSTPPAVDLDFSPSLFSPDNDGENDILTIEPEVEDKFGIEKWSITIFNETGFVFKEFSGNGNPAAEIKWDGLSDKNELVESASDYSMVLTAVDKVGNVSKTGKIKLPIDVLVILTERGLKIRISNIQFKFDSAQLTKKAVKILKRVSDILDRYEKYNVMIEGHTDDIGEEDYNLKLSESRAKSVYTFLIDSGIDEKRLKFRGMGETVPFVKNINEENRRKNRRVEFLLLKKE